MAETRKKGSISENESSVLLERYSATTILSLLQEICKFSSTKIDWDALVKKSSTGISSAREYQMLWRHLAYRDQLEKVEEGAEPLDDDSDIEFELDVVPSVSAEASSEAAAFVKVLSSFCPPNDNGLAIHSTIVAPLTINVPNGQMHCLPVDEQQIDCPSRGAYITVPVSVQIPTHLASNDVVDGNVHFGSGMPPKKKRKTWTKEEEDQLFAGVQTYGEGNWASIAKENFKNERTASQLAQRWSTIRKRRGVLPSIGNATSSSAQSEQVLATRKAVSLALNMPTLGSLSTRTPGMVHSNSCSSSLVFPSAAAPFSPSERPPHSATKVLQQASVPLFPQQASASSVSHKEILTYQNKSRVTVKKIPNQSKPSSATNSAILAAAVAAGGRIATPSDAASYFKVTQSKAAVHIGPVGTSVSTPLVQPMKFPAARTSSMQSRSIRPTVMPMQSVNSGVASSALKTGTRQGKESCFRPPLRSYSVASSLIQKTSRDSKTKECAGRVAGEVYTIDLDEMVLDGTVEPERTNSAVGKVHSSANSFKTCTITESLRNFLNSGTADDSPVVNDNKSVQSQQAAIAEVPNEEVSESRTADDAVAGELLKCQDVHADAVQDHQ